jgi:hypothetical protein
MKIENQRPIYNEKDKTGKRQRHLSSPSLTARIRGYPSSLLSQFRNGSQPVLKTK